MRARISAVILTIFISALSPIHPAANAAVAAGVGVVQNNLLMAFDLANPSGLSGTTLTDLSGNGYSGTIYQTSSQPSLNTSQGNFLSFNGNAGYVDIAKDIVSPSNWTGLSVSFYANMGTRTVVERIFDFGIGQANNNIWVGMGNINRMAIEVFRDGGSPGWCESADNSVGANEWAHWTVVLDGTNCAWYKNNVLSRSVAYANLPWARTLTTNYIGDSNWSVDPSFEGGIGELAIYTSALNSTERTQNFNAQTDITPPTYNGSNPLSANENQRAVGNLTASESVTFSPVSGSGDTNKFTLSGSSLSFVDVPNFEARASASGNNAYTYHFKMMDANGNMSTGNTVLTVNLQDAVEGSAITIPVLSGGAVKGETVTVTVTPSGDGTSIPGKVTYLVAGKRIPGCIQKNYTGIGNSTCTWKPSIQGNREISVTFTPNNSNFTAATSKRSVLITKKSSRR